jgi:predicted TIM-barrel enzyme
MEEAGGADLIVIYNPVLPYGRPRSLAGKMLYGDNGVVEMAREVLLIACTPVLGVCGDRPVDRCRLLTRPCASASAACRISRSSA